MILISILICRCFLCDFDFDAVSCENLILSLKEIGEEGEMIATDMVGEDECIPFPHEAHQVLTQEILHVFSAGALVAAGISSGLSVLGGLLGGARVVAICSSKSHQKYVQKNVTQWLKEKKLVPGTVLPKPPQLQQWEQKKGRGVPRPPAAANGVPSPAPKSMASPSNGSSPTPTPNAGAGVSASANGSSASANGGSPGPTPNAGAASANGGPGRSLLGAFGNVSM